MSVERSKIESLVTGGKGSESFGTKVKFVARFFSLAFGWGIFAVVAIVASWFLSISPTSKSLLANEFQVNSMGPAQTATWHVSCRFSDWPRGECGDPAFPDEFKKTVVVSVGVSKLTSEDYRAVVDKHFMTDRFLHPYIVFWLVLIVALMVGSFITIFAFKRLLATGEYLTKNKRLAGALDLVTGAELSEIVKNSGAGSAFEICEVTLPKQTLVKGVVFAGSQGSGKSTALHDLIRQVKTHNQKTGENV